MSGIKTAAVALYQSFSLPQIPVHTHTHTRRCAEKDREREGETGSE